MGIKNEVVAIWLGYFSSKEEFEEFTKVHYELLETSQDMSVINSCFDNEFSLEKYNREIVEKDIRSSCQSCYELLKNASYLSDYAYTLPKVMSEYNCLVLVYDYQYEGFQKRYSEGINRMDFFENVEYMKDDDVSKWFEAARGK